MVGRFVIVCGVSRRVIGMRMFGSCLMVPAAWGGVRGCCCFYVQAWYRYSLTISIMASRMIDSIAIDDHMQLDQVIDNYLNLDNSDPNPLTSGNINSF